MVNINYNKKKYIYAYWYSKRKLKNLHARHSLQTSNGFTINVSCARSLIRFQQYCIIKMERVVFVSKWRRKGDKAETVLCEGRKIIMNGCLPIKKCMVNCINFVIELRWVLVMSKVTIKVWWTLFGKIYILSMSFVLQCFLNEYIGKCLAPGDNSFNVLRCRVMGAEHKKRFNQLASEVQIGNLINTNRVEWENRWKNIS